MPRFLRSLVSVVEEPLAEPAPDSFRLSRRELGGAMATEAGPEGWWSREALLLQGHTGNDMKGKILGFFSTKRNKNTTEHI